MERYNCLGISLLAFGATVTPFFYFIMSNVPLTALGVSIMILGAVMALTPINPVPKPAVRGLLEGAMLSLEGLLEELDLSERGYYVAHEDGLVYVYVPSSKAEPPNVDSKPRSLVVELKGQPYLVLIPPASALAREYPSTSLEDAVSTVLVDLAELCSGVRVAKGPGYIRVELKRPRGRRAPSRFKRVLGSLEACVTACLAASALKRPVYVSSEVEEKGWRRVTLEVA